MRADSSYMNMTGINKKKAEKNNGKTVGIYATISKTIFEEFSYWQIIAKLQKWQ